MKPFELEDTFLLSKIIDDLDIELDLNKFMDEMKNQNAEYAGGQLFYILAKKWHKGKRSIPEFVASLSEKSIEEVKKMKLNDMKDFFVELLKQDDFQDFFKLPSDE